MYRLVAPQRMNSREGVTNRSVFVFQCCSENSIVVDEIFVTRQEEEDGEGGSRGLDEKNNHKKNAIAASFPSFHSKQLCLHSSQSFVFIFGKGWVKRSCVVFDQAVGSMEDLDEVTAMRWRSPSSQLLLINAISAARRMIESAACDAADEDNDDEDLVPDGLHVASASSFSMGTSPTVAPAALTALCSSPSLFSFLRSPQASAANNATTTKQNSLSSIPSNNNAQQQSIASSHLTPPLGDRTSSSSFSLNGCESCSRLLSIVAPECKLAHASLLCDPERGEPVVIGEGASCRVHLGQLAPVLAPSSSSYSSVARTAAAIYGTSSTMFQPLVAIKVITVPPASAHGRFASICNEIALMEELRLAPHPNLTALVGLLPPGVMSQQQQQRGAGANFSNQRAKMSQSSRQSSVASSSSCRHEVGIAMEYCDGGTLQELVQNIAVKASRGCSPYSLSRSTLVERESMAIFYAVASGLHHLHTTLKILHRDVKPSNIFICCRNHQHDDKRHPRSSRLEEHQQDGWRIKLGDFGVSSTGEAARTRCGTQRYMAPEVGSFAAGSNNNNPHRSRVAKYDARVDVFSLGVTLQFVLSGGCLLSLRKKWVVVMGSADLPSDVWVVPSNLLCRRLWAGEAARQSATDATATERSNSLSSSQRGAAVPQFLSDDGCRGVSGSSHSCLCDDIHADTMHLVNSMVHRDPLRRPADMRECLRHPAMLRHGSRRSAQIKDLIDHVEGKSPAFPIPSISASRGKGNEMAVVVRGVQARQAVPETFDMWTPPSLRFLREVAPLCGSGSKFLGSFILGSSSTNLSQR